MKNKFLLSLCHNLILVAIISILVGCAATTMEAGTKATLRPELTKNDLEVWHILSKGNDITDVEYNAKVRAAYTSRKEGKDCFIILDSKTNEKEYYYKYQTTETLKSHTYVNGRNYTTTYEVPTTDSTYLGTDKITNMYVVFLNRNSCNEQEKKKWRNHIYYNDRVIENYERRRSN